jgi:hemoglobin
MKREDLSPSTRSLYQRLGGPAGISAIVDDVIAAHLANPLVAPRYRHVKDLEVLKRVSREFFGAGSGGPEKYTGKDMRAAHQGMNVSEQEFLAVIDDVMSVLRRHDIDDTTQKDVLAILYGFKNEIIRG